MNYSVYSMTLDDDKPVSYTHLDVYKRQGLKEYMHVFETEPIVQGGCIWDWVDQSFREIDKDGKWYWNCLLYTS